MAFWVVYLDGRNHLRRTTKGFTGLGCSMKMSDRDGRPWWCYMGSIEARWTEENSYLQEEEIISQCRPIIFFSTRHSSEPWFVPFSASELYLQQKSCR